jgi:hypothetical protein
MVKQALIRERQNIKICNSCRMWGNKTDNGTYRQCKLDKLHHSLSETCIHYKERTKNVNKPI